MVFLASGFRVPRRGSCRLRDLFYELKKADVRKQPSVQPSYTYPAAELAARGLFVDLPPWDAHVFELILS